MVAKEAAYKAAAQKEGVGALALTAFILVTAVEAICHRSVVNRRELLDDPRLEEHIVRLVMGFVINTDTKSARRPGSRR